MVEDIPFRKSVISSDENFIIVCTVDKKNNNKDGIAIYDAGNGDYISRLVQCFVKNVQFLVAMPNKPHILAIISIEKCVIVDIRTRLRIRTIEKWNGNITNNGKYGLYSPTRGGLELVDIRKGACVKTFIPRVAEGIVTVLSLFTENDQYVCYYHTARKTIRVFRINDASMIANYRLPAELTSIKSTKDGRSIVLGTIDGILSVFTIADPIIEDVGKYLKDLPSRDEHFKLKLAKKKARRGFKAAVGVIKVSALLGRSRQNSVNNEIKRQELE